MSKKSIRRHAEFMRRVESLGLCRQLNLFEFEASRPPARQASKAG